MAEGVARTLGHRAASAGISVNEDTISENAVEALAEIGIDISEHLPKSIDDFDAADFDRVISMGCGASSPTIPIDEDWGIEDPHLQGLDEFRARRDEIRRLVSAIPLDPPSVESE